MNIINTQFNRVGVCAYANKLIKKGCSRSEAFNKAWKREKNKIFPFEYKCLFCGGDHEVTATTALIMGGINAILIIVAVLKLTGQI